MSSLRVTITLFLVLGLMGCSKEVLLQHLDQKDANDIIVMLSKNGITAEQKAIEKQQEVTWSLSVAKGDVDDARRLLVENNLPRQKELGLSGICKESGLIPTPKMEKCRELLALKGEIINSLQSIPTIVDADVVINMPDKEDFPDENNPPQRPTASVVVQVDDSVQGKLLIDESKIQQFVANAITGMDMRDVAVIISGGGVSADPQAVSLEPIAAAVDEEAETLSGFSGELVSVVGLNMESQSVKKFKIILSALLAFFVIISASLILVLLKLAQTRRQTENLLPVPATPALPEKVSMDRLVEESTQAEKDRKKTT